MAHVSYMRDIGFIHRYKIMKFKENSFFGPLNNKSFSGLLVTQSLGAFNDNFFRSAIVTLVTFFLADISAKESSLYVNLGIGLFMLPYFLFSALAGQISDRFNRSAVIRLTKIAELAIACFASYFFVTQNVNGLMATLFFMGAQSTFFGPAKLSVLPTILGPKQLVQGNALGLSGTYLSILLGIIFGSMAYVGSSKTALPITMISVAVIGCMASMFIEKMEPANPNLHVDKNIFKSTYGAMKNAKHTNPILLTILAASWGWLMASVLVGQLSAIAGTLVHSDNILFLIFVGIFTCGIVLGSSLISKLNKGEVSITLCPIVSILLSAALADLAYATSSLHHFDDVIPASTFFTEFSGWHFSLALFATTTLIGMFLVPFESYLQKIAPENMRSQIIGSENIICSLFIVLGSLLCIAIINSVDLASAYPTIFILLMAANAVVALVICFLLPAPVLRMISKRLLRFFFSVKVTGIENLKAQGDKKTLIIANHTGLLDGLIIWTFIDEELWFAIDKTIANGWLIRKLLSVANYFTVDSKSPMAVKEMIKKVNEGKKVVIFPEGRITTTGSLMKIYPGPAMIAKKTGADVIPLCFEGSQYRFGSYYGPQLKIKAHTAITLKVLPAEKPDFELYKDSKNRFKDTTVIYDILTRSRVAASDLPDETMFTTLIKSCKTLGGNRIVLEDVQTKPVTLKKLVLASFVFGHWFKENEDTDKIGFLLPNSVAAVVTFMGLQACGKVPCMLNFSMGISSILACIDAAMLRTVVTSRSFIELGKLQGVLEGIEQHGIKIIYLEDVKKELGFVSKMRAVIGSRSKYSYYHRLCDYKLDPTAPAVILFTSGSEGKPKGVVLSHRNIQTNRIQLQAVLSFGLQDKLFNAMPMFHSFGLTAGTLLPVLGGIKTYMYPSPLHYKQVPLLVYETNSTALFGTDTFLKNYAKFANPYDMYSVRFAIAGGEKLKDDTKALWFEQFGIRIFEGYGATETAPVISVNTNMFYRTGTVGRILPGIEARLDPIPGIEQGGRLFVKGDNVSLGYLRDSAPGVLEPHETGWYDTGDICDLDADGFVRILGRAKRFAKIAGEMISLTAVEMALSKLYKDTPLAAVTVPDSKKGEAIILFIEKEGVDRKVIKEYFAAEGLPDLANPAGIESVDKIPLNGTGKVDYVKVTAIAREKFVR